MDSKFFDERKLIEGLAAGKMSAYEDFYSQFYRPLCSYAFRIVNDPDEAEDIIQNVIYKLWENRQALVEIKNLRSYLFRSVYNGSINYLKSSRYHDNYISTALFDLKQIEMEAYHLTEYNELKQRIEACIEDLPDQCKKVFKLSRQENKSYNEISEKLNITVKAVEANISRALKTLRKNLKDYLGIFLLL